MDCYKCGVYVWEWIKLVRRLPSGNWRKRNGFPSVMLYRGSPLHNLSRTLFCVLKARRSIQTKRLKRYTTWSVFQSGWLEKRCSQLPEMWRTCFNRHHLNHGETYLYEWCLHSTTVGKLNPYSPVTVVWNPWQGPWFGLFWIASSLNKQYVTEMENLFFTGT